MQPHSLTASLWILLLFLGQPCSFRFLLICHIISETWLDYSPNWCSPHTSSYFIFLHVTFIWHIIYFTCFKKFSYWSSSGEYVLGAGMFFCLLCPLLDPRIVPDCGKAFVTICWMNKIFLYPSTEVSDAEDSWVGFENMSKYQPSEEKEEEHTGGGSVRTPTKTWNRGTGRRCTMGVLLARAWWGTLAGKREHHDPVLDRWAEVRHSRGHHPYEGVWTLYCLHNMQHAVHRIHSM